MPGKQTAKLSETERKETPPPLNPSPGYIPPPSANEHEGDCMRRALACVIGVHPNIIRWIKPNGSAGDFWMLYQDEALRLGYRLEIEDFAPRGTRWVEVTKPDELWIGIVRGRGGRRTHAVVFNGETFHFGEQHRRRHPNKLFKLIRVHKCDERHTKCDHTLLS